MLPTRWRSVVELNHPASTDKQFTCTIWLHCLVYLKQPYRWSCSIDTKEIKCPKSKVSHATPENPISHAFPILAVAHSAKQREGRSCSARGRELPPKTPFASKLMKQIPTVHLINPVDYNRYFSILRLYVGKCQTPCDASLSTIGYLLRSPLIPTGPVSQLVETL